MPKKKNSSKGNDEFAVSGRSKSGGRKNRGGKSRDVSMDRGSEAASDMTHLSLDDDDVDSNGTVARMDEEIADDSDEIVDRKLSEALENTSHKNSAVRLAALKIVTGVLSRYVVPSLVARRSFTVADAAERALKKGGGEEGTLGARLAGLFAVQLGEAAAEQFGPIRTLLMGHLNDPAAPAAFRATCADVLSLCAVLFEEEAEAVLASLTVLRGVWSVFRPGAHGDTSAELFASTLTGWAVHLTLLQPRHRLQLLNADLAKVCAFLDATQMEIRIEGGEAAALLYEIARDADAEFRPSNHQQTIETLDMLATDPERHRGKKDRRLQRSTFRQIAASVMDDECPTWKVKFDSEMLDIQCWQDKVVYEWLCGLLRGGLTFQLRGNALVRAVFSLGPPSDHNNCKADQKLNKSEIQAYHAMNTKFRKQVRGRQRDKKTTSLDL